MTHSTRQRTENYLAPRLLDAVHAEWTKLRTSPGTAWLLLATTAVTVAFSAAGVAATSYTNSSDNQDTTKLSLTGLDIGQATIAILAVFVIAGEYSTGMIRITLAAMPHRLTVLAAKAATLTTLVLVAGSVAVLASLLTGRLILAGHGLTTAHGYPTLSLTHGPTLRAAAGSVLYLGLIGLLSLGIATAARDSATATGITLGLLYLFPILAHSVNTHWQRHLDQIAPMTAGLDIQATTGLPGLSLGPWQGLAVLAGWAAIALIAGALLLQVRDA
jgi:ABC-2 type transport system permease protein